MKLRFEVTQSTVARYMAKGRLLPSQSWKAFVRNQSKGIAAINMLVGPPVDLRMLFVLVIVGIDGRCINMIAVTANPTVDWAARHVTEAFRWYTAPEYLIRNRDRAYGCLFKRRCQAMGIGIDRPRSDRNGRMTMLNA